MAVQEFIDQKLNEWFADSTVTSDKALMKKLANSVATPGSSGELRTLDALSSIPRWDSLNKSLSKDDAVRILRDETSDFRKAKSFLANQSKCINAFPKFFLEEEDKLNNEAVHVINLFPKNPAKVDYHTITVYISKTSNELKKAVMKSKDGTTMTYSLSKFTSNPEIEDTKFVFDLKKYPGYNLIKD